MLNQILGSASKGLFSLSTAVGKGGQIVRRKLFVIMIIIALLLVLAAPLG